MAACCCDLFRPSWSSLVDFWRLVIVVLVIAFSLILATVFPCRWSDFFMLVFWLLVLCGFGLARSSFAFWTFTGPLGRLPALGRMSLQAFETFET